MKTIIVSLILMFLVTSVYCADVVQIATTRDASGKFNNWVVQVVTWDATPVTDIPDPYATSNNALQIWYFPTSDTEWLKATFLRPILGPYGMRWSRDGLIWSDPAVCVILKPGKPQGGN